MAWQCHVQAAHCTSHEDADKSDSKEKPLPASFCWTGKTFNKDKQLSKADVAEICGKNRCLLSEIVKIKNKML